MDQEQIQKAILERFNNLQPEIQAIILDPSYDKNIVEIATRYELKPEEISELELSTTMVLLGQIHPDDYKTSLTDDLDIPEYKIDNIIKDIGEKVFKNVLEIIKKNFRADETEDRIISDLPDSYYEEGYFAKLPKEVQDAVRESDYRTKLYNIAKDKDFSIDQMKNLEEVTNKVLLNVIHPDKYEAELKDKLGLSSETVSEIVSKVNEEILKNIREILRTNWEKSNRVVQKEEDEVPLPPYAVAKPEAPKIFTYTVPKPAKEAPKTESSIYKSAGIEMVDSEPQKEDVMKNIIGSKLSLPTVSKPVVSNQTVPKMTPVTTPVIKINTTQTPASTEKPHDPYHEAV